MKLTVLLLLLTANTAICSAQSAKKDKAQLKLTAFNVAVTNSHTAIPFGSFSELFYKNVHPGIEISTGFNWSEKRKHNWTQTFTVGYSYHAHLQHSLMIYTEAGYQYKLSGGFSTNAKIGFGYLHSKEDSKVFVLDADGEYKESEKFGRSHPMASLSLGAEKKIGSKGFAVFMYYQQRFQISFIDAYVPALPVNAIAIGVTVPFKKNNQNQQQ